MRPTESDLLAPPHDTSVWTPPAGLRKLRVYLVTGAVIVLIGAAALSLHWVVALGGLLGVLLSSILIASALPRPVAWGVSWLALAGSVWSLFGGAGGLLAPLVAGIVVSLFLLLWTTAAGVVLHLAGDRAPEPVVAEAVRQQ